MPEFSDINSVYSKDKKLTKPELIRAIKFAIASEFEAVQVYQQIIEGFDSVEIKRVIEEIIFDEKKHAGGFLKLLELIAPDELDALKKGGMETLENYKK